MNKCKWLMALAATLIILLLSGFGCETKQPHSDYWTPPETSHKWIPNNSYKLLWTDTNIFSTDLANLSLAANNDKVFILGSTGIEESSRINALDGITGKVVWKSDTKTLFTIFADEEELYVGESGIGGKVVRYDPDTGESLWAKNFWVSGGVHHLIVYEGQLNVYLSPDHHRVLRTSNGKAIFSIFKSPPFFDSGLCGSIYQTPVYTDDTIYFRTELGLLKGEICAVDKLTGKLRWKSDLGVISNVVANNEMVFVLVESGDLLTLDPSTGKEIRSLRISFETKPFILYSTSTTSGGYFLAYDTKNQIIFVLLGDSRQLFAFKLLEN